MIHNPNSACNIPNRSTFTIPEVSADAIMEAVEGICLAGSKGLVAEEVANYIGKTKEYARRCINLAIQLKMIKELDGKYIVETESEDISQAKKEQWPIFFRKFLQRYQPFLLFVSLINRGNSTEEACRKVKIIYGISTDVKIIRKSLITWGKYADILEMGTKDAVKVKISTEPTPDYIKELIEALESDIKVRIYMANKLTDEVFGYLQHDEIEFLVKGLRRHQNDPRGSIEDAGKAFEDFLRRIGVNKGVDLSKSSGIGQCAQSLRKADVIMQKHIEMCEHVNAFRLAAAHSKEKSTLTSWKINSDAAIETVLTILTLIRSIFFYVFKKEQII